MLLKILDYIATKKITTTAILADRMGVSEKIVKQLLMELADGGYLELIKKESYSNPCNSCIANCADSKEKAEKKHLAAWVLTDRGERAI